MKNNTILFVDDEPNILNSLKRLFRHEGYNILTAGNAEEGLALVQVKQPSIIVSDQQMPKITGDQFLKEAKKWNSDSIRILLTGHSDMKATVQAINEGGIYRYISKPWDDDEIRLIIRQAAEYLKIKTENQSLTELAREQNIKLKSFNINLEKKVQERTFELNAAKGEMENNLYDFVKIFVGIMGIYNPVFATHGKKVSALSLLVGEKMGFQKEQLNTLEMAALLHDIGMIGMPRDIMTTSISNSKPKDKEAFKKHPEIGEATLSFMKQFKEVALIIRSHHENYDGTGFPDHLNGDFIPVESRIISLIDIFDEAKMIGVNKIDSPDTDIKPFIVKNSGKRFDPGIVKILFETLKELQQKKTFEKLVSVSELQEGMVISRDIISSNGLFRIVKETPLKEMHIQRIKTYIKLGLVKGEFYVNLSIR